jgi:uncharacterized Fe-S cluster protein YjdI
MDAFHEAPEEFREEPRYKRTVERVYRNDQIEVTWEPAFCIHVAECLRGLPRVFDSWRRPWIVVDNGSPDEIAEVVQRCPTGALHFRRLDGGPQEAGTEETTVQLRPNGPLFVRGKIRIEDLSGHVVRGGHSRRSVQMRRIRAQAVLRRDPSQDRVSVRAGSSGMRRLRWHRRSIGRESGV